MGDVLDFHIIDGLFHLESGQEIRLIKSVHTNRGSHALVIVRILLGKVEFVFRNSVTL